jgi:hypothetical protein
VTIRAAGGTIIGEMTAHWALRPNRT